MKLGWIKSNEGMILEDVLALIFVLILLAICILALSHYRRKVAVKRNKKARLHHRKVRWHAHWKKGKICMDREFGEVPSPRQAGFFGYALYEYTEHLEIVYNETPDCSRIHGNRATARKDDLVLLQQLREIMKKPRSSHESP